MENHLTYLQEWLHYARSGEAEKAEEIYFEKLFSVIIDNFRKKHTDFVKKGGALFSILGFSPEPIILTASVVEPEVHVIFTNNKTQEGNQYLERYLKTGYVIISLADGKFNTVYRALKEQLYLNPLSDIVVDITGGKKSMVASAAIFGKDYGCKVVYVDFEEYYKDLRKPKPGTEYLAVVYTPNENQPELFIQ